MRTRKNLQQSQDELEKAIQVTIDSLEETQRDEIN